VAVKMEGNDSVVMETGLDNLDNDEVPVLIHFDADRQEGRTLTRLNQPEEPAPQSQQSPLSCVPTKTHIQGATISCLPVGNVRHFC
jgi:hypothetical protein